MRGAPHVSFRSRSRPAGPVLGLALIAGVLAAGPLATAQGAAGSKDKPLPRVLLIGDSISQGYTGPVKQFLTGRARVFRNPGNAMHTRHGLAQLERWLGKERWDVIHFNWGLHDLCWRHSKSKVYGHRDKVRGKLTTSIEEYESNLRLLVTRLGRTGAKLIWATTTPVPPGEAGRHEGDGARYNQAAAKVVREAGVATNDLHALVLDQGKGHFVRPGDVHFTRTGYEILGRQVARTILRALRERKLLAPPLVATHYFYWYRWPGEHFNPLRLPGREGHRHRLPTPGKVSYLDPAWHAGELRAMAAAGIDAALPVYWGAPGAYEKADIRFSRYGLRAMVKALENLARQKIKHPRLGLFYDTSTLLGRVRGDQTHPGRADLHAPWGRALFTRTVVDFFKEIPPRFWARRHGRPLVVLYVSSFASRWRPDLGAELARAFTAAFPGERPFLVADASWGRIGQDRTTAWGAALHGPKLFPGVAQVGPGYDDSPVPGRTTPIRRREGGGFYRHSWRAALAHLPELVLIETWNEMHEGTEICRTVETDNLYLDITREWIARLKAGGEPGPTIPLRHPRPLARPDLSWGAEAKGNPAVSVSFAPHPPQRKGLREGTWEDGPSRLAGGALCGLWRAKPGVSYLYFQVSDHWRFEIPRTGSGSLEVRLLTREPDAPGLEYDSHDHKAILRGAYTWCDPVSRRQAPGGLWEHRYLLTRPRLANRQNGGADFRLVLRKGTLSVIRITLKPTSP